MPTVTEDLDDLVGGDPQGVVVELSLVGTNKETITGYQVSGTLLSPLLFRPAGDGTWSKVLEANTGDLAGTRYRRRVLRDHVVLSDQCIEVTATPDPQEFRDILDDPPATPESSALTVHKADSAAHSTLFAAHNLARIGPSVHSDDRPADGLSWGRPRLERVENQSIGAGQTAVVADIAGAGVVRGIWVAMVAGLAIGGDGVLRVFVDGEVTPAVEVDWGTLCCTHFGFDADIFCRHVHGSADVPGTGATPFSGAVTFPMPFSNGCRVELHNPGGTGRIYYSQVAWDDSDPPPYRLRSRGVTRLNAPTILAAATYEFFDLADVGQGWLVYHAIAGDGVSNRSWLERDVEVHIDGEATASWASTGFEDWFFGGGWFWSGRSAIGEHHTMVGVNSDSTFQVAAAIDLAAAFGGLRFETGLRLVLGTEGFVTTDHTMGWCALYYLHT